MISIGRRALPLVLVGCVKAPLIGSDVATLQREWAVGIGLGTDEKCTDDCLSLFESAVSQGYGTKATKTGTVNYVIEGIRQGEFERVEWYRAGRGDDHIRAWPRGGPIPLADAAARWGFDPPAFAGTVSSGGPLSLYGTGRQGIYVGLTEDRTKVEYVYRTGYFSSPRNEPMLEEVEKRLRPLVTANGHWKEPLPSRSEACRPYEELAPYVATVGSSTSYFEDVGKELKAGIARCKTLRERDDVTLAELKKRPPPTDFRAAVEELRLLEANPTVRAQVPERIATIAQLVEAEIARRESLGLHASAALLGIEYAKWSKRSDEEPTRKAALLALGPLAAMTVRGDAGFLVGYRSWVAERLGLSRLDVSAPCAAAPCEVVISSVSGDLSKTRKTRTEKVTRQVSVTKMVDDPRAASMERMRATCGNSTPLSLSYRTVEKVVELPDGKRERRMVKEYDNPPPSNCDTKAYDALLSDIMAHPIEGPKQVVEEKSMPVTLEITEDRWSGELRRSVELHDGAWSERVDARAGENRVRTRIEASGIKGHVADEKDEIESESTVKERARASIDVTLRNNVAVKLHARSAEQSARCTRCTAEEKAAEETALRWLMTGAGDRPHELPVPAAARAPKPSTPPPFSSKKKSP